MTMVAPSQRLSFEDIAVRSQTLDVEKLGLSALENLPAPIMLLNHTRQIVFANRALREISQSDLERLLGRRPGEAIGCENAELAEGGCGCSDPCSTCGAVLSILQGLQGDCSSDDCRITRRYQDRIEALDLRISVQPLEFEEEPFVLVFLTDISAEKRRQNLEKIFFHDVLNVAGSIRGFTDILLDYDLSNPREVLEQLQLAAQQMIDEVEGQRLLSQAESGDLSVAREPVETLSLLERVVKLMQGHEVAEGKTLEIARTSCREIFLSDATLLSRCLVNLCKNALEASDVGETVTLESHCEQHTIHFSVKNSAVISPEAQLQMFQRSFSTKGRGRGLGTYSVRLLVERYLAGKVTFVSDEACGTCFTLTLPR